MRGPAFQVDLGSERGSGHVHASDGISRCFSRLWRHLAPAYTFHHLFFIDLVPAHYPLLMLHCKPRDLARDWLIT